jgi:hypothetical protein
MPVAAFSSSTILRMLRQLVVMSKRTTSTVGSSGRTLAVRLGTVALHNIVPSRGEGPPKGLDSCGLNSSPPQDLPYEKPSDGAASDFIEADLSPEKLPASASYDQKLGG